MPTWNGLVVKGVVGRTSSSREPSSRGPSSRRGHRRSNSLGHTKSFDGFAALYRLTSRSCMARCMRVGENGAGNLR